MNRWDRYFFEIAKAVANNSPCFSRKIGVVIVKDKSIISTGYNGPPRGIPHCNERYYTDNKLIAELNRLNIDIDSLNVYQCPRRVLGFKSGEGLEWCYATHAEVNAIVNAARLGVSVKGSIMYMTCNIPCFRCMTAIINAGISELVVSDLSYYDSQTTFLLKNTDLKIRMFEL